MTVAKIVANTVANTPVNLQRRGNLFWTNLRLPELAGRTLVLPSGPVRIGKNGYLRVSLETGDKKEAEKRSRKLSVQIDDALDDLSSKTTAAHQPITPSDIQRGADYMAAVMLAADDDTYKSAVTAALAGQEPDALPDRDFARAPPPGVKNDVNLLHRLRAEIPFFMLQATGKVPAGPVTPDYLPFVAAFRTAAAQLEERGKGKVIPTPADPRPKNNKAATFGWDDLLTYYYNAHPLSERTLALYGLVTKSLANFCKCPPGEIKRAQVIDWRDSLVKQLAPKTALTRVRAGNSIYSYARINLKLGNPAPVNAFELVSVVGAKSAASSRQEFSLENLKKIFATQPALADIPVAAGAHAALWLPLLAAFTGARREELTGLLADEVLELKGHSIWYLDLKDNELRKLKKLHGGASCVRKVPIHKTLVKLGFLDYVRAVKLSKVKRFFPGIARGDACADFVINHIHQKITPPGVGILQDVHSFRHTFITACRNVPLQTDIQKALTGHELSGAAGGYGSVGRLSILKAELDRISYPGVIFLAPPVPTPAELKAQQAAAEVRLQDGARRMVGKTRAAVRTTAAVRKAAKAATR
jgi:integrase